MNKLNWKRIYEKTKETDGFRVFVDRLWARGIKKEDIKNIAVIGVEGVSIISAISYSEHIKQTVEQMINEYKNYVE